MREYQRVGNQPKFRYKEPVYVANEIQELVEKYNITKLSFCDEDFFGDKQGVKRALELFKILMERNIKVDLHVNARVNTVMWLAKNNYLDFCSAAGVKYMYVGLESYNNDSLKLFDKAITTKEIDFVVDELKQHNIRINPGLITFDPTLTLEKVKQNVELFKRIDYYDAFIFTRRLVLYPNASEKIQKLFENNEYFKDSNVKLLYNAMVEYRDKVFPFYIKLNRNIVNEEIVEKIQEFHFNCFDNVYNALKNGDELYEEVLKNSITETENYIKKLIKQK